MPISSVCGTSAYAAFRKNASRKKVREHTGDHLEDFVPSSLLCPEPGCVWVSFNSILQGDHAGVEIATESHSNLLASHGLLRKDCRLVASSPLQSFDEAQGLVIDDFFAVSIQDRSVLAEDTRSAIAYRKAQVAYSAYGLQGSPEKDIVSKNEGKVIGAFINGAHRATSRGMVLVGAPVEKRLGLSVLSLLSCQLPFTSDSFLLCLLGGWASILGYRRPLMSVLQSAYHLVDMQSFDANHPRLVPLSRKVALELVTLAVLMPLAVADIAAPIDKKLYCTDASLKKGAILETSLEDRLMQVLYRATINKGSYTRMLSSSASILKAYDLSFEEDEDEGEATQKLPADRPIAFSFEFIEVYAGSSKITKYLAEMGIICGPALDLSLSEEYDLRRIHVISWLTFLVAE